MLEFLLEQDVSLHFYLQIRALCTACSQYILLQEGKNILSRASSSIQGIRAYLEREREVVEYCINNARVTLK